MRIGSFRVFRDLVDSQSFSKAAQLNSVTQSAVSQQIRAMEECFHTPLIERNHKRFALTREGQALYETSNRVIFEYDSMKHRLEEMGDLVFGTIRVSTIYSIGLHELPPYVKHFLKEYPKVQIHLDYRRSNQVYDEVIKGTCDMGLVAYPVQKNTIKLESFRKDRLVLIVSPQHPLAGKKEVVIADLANEKFVGFESDIPTRKAIDKIFRQANVEIKYVMEFDNIETVKRTVEIEAGISIVPRSTVEQEVKNNDLVAIEFKGQPYFRPLGILYKNGRVLSPAMKMFLKTLHEPLESSEGGCGS